jgi:flagellar M-ring protein FliF
MAADPATVPNLATHSSGLPASLRPLLLLVGIAAAVAAGVWIVLWSRGPTYSLLYANLSPQDEAQVAQALESAQIPYRLDPGANGIEVAAERLDEARLKLAGQGLTDNDSFAALEKSSGFGVSQFMEDVRYQHALEMELARTIASLQPVAGARVNLAEPRQSVFVSDNRGASASVFVELKSGASLEPEQVQAIINLVASSVPNLSPGEVTVVDQQGRLLSAPSGHDPYAMDDREYDMVHRMETDYARRIESLLTPLVGPGLVHAQVVAELNLGTREQAKELYTPNSQIVRSEHLSQQSAGAPGSGGVPGSLSNEPPAPGVLAPIAAAKANAPAGQNATGASSAGSPAAQANGPAAGAAGAAAGAARTGATQPVGGSMAGGDTTSSDVTRNYEIDRTLDYSNQPAGTVRRLTVAVLIGDRTVNGPDGKAKRVPLSAEELTRVTQLVKDAVGFDASRGDSVSVMNESLDTASTPAAEEGNFQSPPLWQSPFVWSLLRIVAGLVGVLVLVLSVLRPLVRTLITPMRLAGAAPAGAQALTGATPGGPAGAAAALPAAQRDAATALSHEQQLTQARTMVNQDPKRVAQVVRGWVGQDE